MVAASLSEIDESKTRFISLRLILLKAQPMTFPKMFA